MTIYFKGDPPKPRQGPRKKTPPTLDRNSIQGDRVEGGMVPRDDGDVSSTSRVRPNDGGWSSTRTSYFGDQYPYFACRVKPSTNSRRLRTAKEVDKRLKAYLEGVLGSRSLNNEKTGSPERQNPEESIWVFNPVDPGTE